MPEETKMPDRITCEAEFATVTEIFWPRYRKGLTRERLTMIFHRVARWGTINLLGLIRDHVKGNIDADRPNWTEVEAANQRLSPKRSQAEAILLDPIARMWRTCDPNSLPRFAHELLAAYDNGALQPDELIDWHDRSNEYARYVAHHAGGFDAAAGREPPRWGTRAPGEERAAIGIIDRTLRRIAKLIPHGPACELWIRAARVGFETERGLLQERLGETVPVDEPRVAFSIAPELDADGQRNRLAELGAHVRTLTLAPRFDSRRASKAAPAPALGR